MADTLNLVVQNRSGVILNTKAKSISSFNLKGRFDVLPQHVNLISLIEKYLTYIDTSGKLHEVKIDRALMKVSSNNISVYLSV